MSEERFDFSALDLQSDPDRFERMVGNITWRARIELARRAAMGHVTPVDVLAAWSRPAMAAAAVIAVVSMTLLATIGRPQVETEIATGAYMSGTEVPAALTSWYEEGNSPTATEVLVAGNEGGN